MNNRDQKKGRERMKIGDGRINLMRRRESFKNDGGKR